MTPPTPSDDSGDQGGFGDQGILEDQAPCADRAATDDEHDGSAAEHELARTLRAAAAGRFPPVDGLVEVVPPYLDGVEAVVAFTGHAVVATRMPVRALVDAGADGFAGATSIPVMTLLAGEGGTVDVLDALLVAAGTGGGTLPARPDLDLHPRVGYARAWRRDVRVFGDERGMVTLSRGLGGLLELSFEVDADRRGAGLGRSLLREALGLAPPGEPVLAAVAPGNAASLRALLAGGFTPVGSVQLVRPRRRRPGSAAAGSAAAPAAARRG
jgi:GNAT superfamily N-acetyltransferase